MPAELLRQLEPRAAGQKCDDELVEAHAFRCGLGYEVCVQARGHAHEDFAGGFHAVDGIACAIDNASSACDTECMSKTAAAQTISAPLVLNTRRTANYKFHGPTKVQARKLAALRLAYITDSAAALAAGDDDKSFDLDCSAWDIENDLRSFGFDIETGRPA